MFSYIKKHRAYQSFFSSTQEKRLVFDTPHESPVSPAAPATSPQYPESRDKDITKVTEDVDGQINEATAKVEGFPDPLKQQLRDNVAQYCRTTYDVQVERDGVVKWREDVMTKVQEILEGLVGGVEKAKDEAEDKKEKLKSLEEEIKELPSQLEEVSDEGLDLNEANLQNPESLQTELDKYQQRAENIQQHQGTLSNYFKDATDVQQAFQKEMSSGLGNVIGGGVVLGTTAYIIAGATLNLVTAGVGVLSMVAGGVIVKAAGRSGELARARMANEALKQFKSGFNERQQTLAGLVRDMHADGDKLHNAAPSLRSQIEQNRAKGVADVLQAGERVGEQRAEAMKRRDGLERLRVTIGEKRAALGEQYNTWMEQFTDATEHGGTLNIKKEDCQGNLNRINEAIVALENSGADKGQNAGQYIRLRDMRHLLIRGIDVMDNKDKSINAVLTNGDHVEKEFKNEVDMMEFNLDAVAKSNESLDMVMGDLDQQISVIDSAHGLIDETAAQYHDILNRVEPEVIGGVAAIALSNIQALGATQMQWKTLEPMTVEAPSYFASVGNMLAAPINLVFKVGHGLSALGKAIPIPGLSHAVRFIGGVSEGIGDIGGALIKLPALLGGALRGEKEGVETVQGILNICAVGLTEGSRKAWGGMGKAIIAYEDWGKGSDVEAFGKAATNIALFLIPGAGQGLNAFRVAGTVAGKGLATRLVAGARGVVVGNIEAYASMPGAVVRGAVRLIKRPFIGRQAALASEVTRLGSAATTAETGLRSIQIGGQTLDDIARGANCTLDDLGRMTPDEFGRTCGLHEGSTLGDIQRTVRAHNLAKQRVDLIQKVAEAKEGVQALEAEQAAEEAVAATEGATEAAGTTAGGAGEAAEGGVQTATEGVASTGAPGEGVPGTTQGQPGAAPAEGVGARPAGTPEAPGRVEGERIEGAVDQGLDDFLRGRNKTIRSRNVANEIAETDDLMRSPNRTPEEIVQLQRQRVQLESLQESIGRAQRARARLKGTKVATSNELDVFLRGESNTINRASIAREIQACEDILKNPGIDDVARARLTKEVENFTDLYNNVDYIQVSRGLKSRPLNRLASGSTVPEGAPGTPGSVISEASPGTAAAATPMEAGVSGVPLRVPSRAFLAGRAVRNFGVELYNRPLLGAPLRGVRHVYNFVRYLRGNVFTSPPKRYRWNIPGRLWDGMWNARGRVQNWVKNRGTSPKRTANNTNVPPPPSPPVPRAPLNTPTARLSPTSETVSVKDFRINMWDLSGNHTQWTIDTLKKDLLMGKVSPFSVADHVAGAIERCAQKGLRLSPEADAAIKDLLQIAEKSKTVPIANPSRSAPPVATHDINTISPNDVYRLVGSPDSPGTVVRDILKPKKAVPDVPPPPPSPPVSRATTTSAARPVVAERPAPSVRPATAPVRPSGAPTEITGAMRVTARKALDKISKAGGTVKIYSTQGGGSVIEAKVLMGEPAKIILGNRTGMAFTWREGSLVKAAMRPIDEIIELNPGLAL